jgi:ABC-type bacteriocin/lantibiotic exporter with double-glycine peptidase domain
MAIMLTPPPVVTQGGALICWAAAVSSWTQACYGKKLAPSEIIKVFRAEKLVDQRGMLEVKGIFRLAEVFQLLTDPPLSKLTLNINTPLASTTLEPKLKQGHVLVTYRTSSMTVSHWIVIYGIDTNKVYFMDPMKNTLQDAKVWNFLVDRWLGLWLKPGPRALEWPPKAPSKDPKGSFFP